MAAGSLRIGCHYGYAVLERWDATVGGNVADGSRQRTGHTVTSSGVPISSTSNDKGAPSRA